MGLSFGSVFQDQMTKVLPLQKPQVQNINMDGHLEKSKSLDLKLHLNHESGNPGTRGLGESS